MAGEAVLDAAPDHRSRSSTWAKWLQVGQAATVANPCGHWYWPMGRRGGLLVPNTLRLASTCAQNSRHAIGITAAPISYYLQHQRGYRSRYMTTRSYM